MIAGLNTKLQVAHTKLSFSRAFMVRAYFLQTHEMLFDAHHHSLSALGGVPERGIYDNMKTAVDKVGKGKDPTINKRFLAMASHYLFEPDFCNPEFKQQTIHDVWQEEKPHLMPMPQAFDGYVVHSKCVTTTCLVTYDLNRYSVSAAYANQAISLHVYADRLDMVAEGGTIANHKRVFTRHHHTGHTIYDWRHYVPVLQRIPGALRNGAPFLGITDSFRALQKVLLKRKGVGREMTDILALVLQYPEAELEQAIVDALKSGHPSKEHVINCLSRLHKEAPVAPVSTPEQLVLTTEPKAEALRYDQLRGLH